MPALMNLLVLLLLHLRMCAAYEFAPPLENPFQGEVGQEACSYYVLASTDLLTSFSFVS